MASLAEAGSGPEHVLRVQCYLLDARDFGAWNERLGRVLRRPAPVRTTIVTGFTPRACSSRSRSPLASRREGGRRRRRHLRALLRVLPAASATSTSRSSTARRSAPARRRPGATAAGSPRPRRAATRARADGLRTARLAPGGLGALLPGRATSRACALARPLLDVLQPARLRPRTAALAALGKRLLRARRRDGRRTGSSSSSGSSAWCAPPRSPRTHGRCCAASRGCGHGYDLPDDILGEDEIHAARAVAQRPREGRIPPGRAMEREGGHARRRGSASKLREMGVEFLEGAEVIEFERTDDVVRSVRTGAGDISADEFVLAGGSWTTTSPQSSAFDPDGAGQGVLVPPHAEGDAEARHPLRRHPRGSHAARRPRTDRRHDGVLGLRPLDRPAADPNLFELARGYVDLERPDYEEPWAGLRPMTVDGLPILDWRRRTGTPPRDRVLDARA